MSLARVSLVLPLGTFLLIWGLITIHRGHLGMARASVRGTLVLAFVAFEAVLLGVTELLNVGHHLSAGPVIAAWFLAVLATGAAFVWSGGTRTLEAWIRAGGLARGRRAIAATPAPVVIAVVVLAGFSAVLIAMAWVYLPNNPDSNVYHLARVANWVQNASVDHYATHVLAQLELAPLHEFNMLHLHVLVGTDRLDGFVEVAAFVVCVVGASELVRLLGGAREVQVGAAVIAATVPSVLLEATSTQNNLFAAAIAVGLVLILLVWEPSDRVVLPAIALGLGVGLAVLAKGIVAPLVGPVVLLLAGRIAVAEARRSCWAAMARRASVVALVGAAAALLMVGPFLKRNHDLFDSFSGPTTRATLNQGTSARHSAANVVRSVAVQFRVGDGDSGIESVTSRVVLDGLRHVRGWTGAPIDDEAFRIGSPLDVFAHGDFTEFQRGEDYGANPWHVVLILFAGIALAVRAPRGDQHARVALLLGTGLAVGFIVFTSTTRWSLYVVRYQVPLFVLWAPLIAVALAGVHRYLLRVAAVFLIVASLPSLLDSLSRPMLDRRESTTDLDPYFAPRPEDGVVLVPVEDYIALRDALVATGCDRIAVGNVLIFEYPLWVGLEHAGWTGEIHHVRVANESKVLEDPGFEPCATVRQRSWNAPLEPIDGQVDIDFGGLVLSVGVSSSP